MSNVSTYRSAGAEAAAPGGFAYAQGSNILTALPGGLADAANASAWADTVVGSGGGSPTLTMSTFWVGTVVEAVTLVESGLPTPMDPSRLDTSTTNSKEMIFCDAECVDCIPGLLAASAGDGCGMQRGRTSALVAPASTYGASIADGVRFGTSLPKASSVPISILGPATGGEPRHQWGLVIDAEGRGRRIVGCDDPPSQELHEVFVTSAAVGGTSGDTLVIAGGTEFRFLRVATLEDPDPCSPTSPALASEIDTGAHANAVPFLLALDANLDLAWHEALVVASGTSSPRTPLYFSDIAAMPDGRFVAVGIAQGELHSLRDATEGFFSTGPDPQIVLEVVGGPGPAPVLQGLARFVSGTQDAVLTGRHSNYVESIVPLLDGRLLSGNQAGTTCVWNACALALKGGAETTDAAEIDTVKDEAAATGVTDCPDCGRLLIV
jgi:hypothetical protein